MPSSSSQIHTSCTHWSSDGCLWECHLPTSSLIDQYLHVHWLLTVFRSCYSVLLYRFFFNKITSHQVNMPSCQILYWRKCKTFCLNIRSDNAFRVVQIKSKYNGCYYDRFIYFKFKVMNTSCNGYCCNRFIWASWDPLESLMGSLSQAPSRYGWSTGHAQAKHTPFKINWCSSSYPSQHSKSIRKHILVNDCLVAIFLTITISWTRSYNIVFLQLFRSIICLIVYKIITILQFVVVSFFLAALLMHVHYV